MSFTRDELHLERERPYYDEQSNIKKLTVEMLIDAIDSVTWYNNLAEDIVKWKDMNNYNTSNPYGEPYPEGWLSPKSDFLLNMYGIDQAIWMICVCLFGDYGTSPRSGWIERKDEFFNFIDDITKTYREVMDEESHL